MTRSLIWARNLLDVPYMATKQEIKIAWKEKLKIHHPDVKGGSHVMAKKLNAAKYILTKSAEDDPVCYYTHDKDHVKFYPFESMEDEMFFWNAVLHGTLDSYFQE